MIIRTDKICVNEICKITGRKYWEIRLLKELSKSRFANYFTRPIPKPSIKDGKEYYSEDNIKEMVEFFDSLEDPHNQRIWNWAYWKLRHGDTTIF